MGYRLYGISLGLRGQGYGLGRVGQTPVVAKTEVGGAVVAKTVVGGNCRASIAIGFCAGFAEFSAQGFTQKVDGADISLGFWSAA